MTSTPCGCEQYEDAQAARPDEREALLAQCGGNAMRWGCPRVVGGEQHPDNTEALRRVETLTGCPEGSLRTCPRYEACDVDVMRALRLYRAAQSGGLSFDEDPPAYIVTASEVIGSSDASRVEKEQEESERERDR